MDFGTRKAGQGDAPPPGTVTDTTSAGFVKDVIEASRSVPVIVDFWAPWCGPCKQLTPILEKVVKSHGGKVRLVKVNVDENQAIAAQLRVQSIPTVYGFRDGQPIDGFAGAQPESAIKAFVEQLIGVVEDPQANIADVLATGEELLEQGDLQGAAEVFASILQEDRENAEALAGLAQCYLKSGDLSRARQTIGLVVPEKRNLAAMQSVTAALDLLEKAQTAAGDIEQLEGRLEANEKDHAARFDLAVALAATGNKAEALEHLLEIVRMDRKWNDEAARKQLVQLFDAWGPKDELVGEGRRRLSSILFS
jgi:putative thioredoxin